MSALVLVDTSAWTQAIRRNGDPVVRQRVQQLMATERAAWCEPVRLELWKGARSQDDRSTLQQMEQSLPRLTITAEVWDAACRIADKARAAGFPLPTIDILIFACARTHQVEIEHVDRHYEILNDLETR